jgi:HK97 family phage prohead protease
MKGYGMETSVIYRPNTGLETKFCKFERSPSLGQSGVLSGYASLFDTIDQGGDSVAKGAYAAALAQMSARGTKVKMLWQHDPASPIGVWDDIREDGRGLWVSGRLLESVAKGREARALIEAGAIDGLSIGYRVVKSYRSTEGVRVLTEVELWEVSLVTFPMLSQARVAAQKAEDRGAGDIEGVTRLLNEARAKMRQAGQ